MVWLSSNWIQNIVSSIFNMSDFELPLHCDCEILMLDMFVSKVNQESITKIQDICYYLGLLWSNSLYDLVIT